MKVCLGVTLGAAELVVSPREGERQRAVYIALARLESGLAEGVPIDQSVGGSEVLDVAMTTVRAVLEGSVEARALRELISNRCVARVARCRESRSRTSVADLAGAFIEVASAGVHRRERTRGRLAEVEYHENRDQHDAEGRENQLRIEQPHQ